jgi:2-hydroxymuconate-semialdehyde hydrolase
MQSKFTMVGDIRTHYLEAGEGDHHVILLHGGEYGGSAQNSWEHNIDVLAKNFHVYALDMVGYGETDKLFNFNDAGALRLNHIKKFMEILCIESASFIGNSMGGGLILKVASMEQPLWNIDKAITINGGGPMNPEPFQILNNYDCTREYMNKIHDLLFYDDKWKTADYVEKRYQSSIQPGAWEALSAARLSSPLVKKNAVASKSMPEYSPEYKSIKKPVLVCAGVNDTLKLEDYADKLSGLIPTSKVQRFENCSHNAQIEKADEFNKIAASFLLQD